MKIKKGLIVAVLATLCLAVTLFATVPTKSQSGGYDPWVDVNNDGSIDMLDISIAIDDFMTYGTPLTKAGIMYDSGWVNISDKCGQAITINHNLGSSDLTMEITGKKFVDSGAHQMHYGLVNQPGWRKLYGDKTLGYEDEESNCIIHTKDGGYAITGRRLQSSPTTNYDILLVKTDSTGDVEWTRTYDGGYSYDDCGNSVIEASDGGYVIAGSTDNSTGTAKLYMIKTDMKGNMVWIKNGYVGDNVGVLNDVIEVSDGYVAVGFYSVLPKRRVLACKVDKSTGFSIFMALGSNIKDAMFSSVLATWTGDLVFAGTNDNFADMPHAAWWYKTNSDISSVLGEKAYNATAMQDVIDDMIPAYGGGFVLAGSAYNVNNRQGGWLIRVNATGDALWDRKYSSGSYECHINSAAMTGDGACVVFGIYWDSATSGAWTAKIDMNGSLVWSKVDDQTVIWNKVAGTLTDDGGYEGYVFAAHALTADYRCFVVRKVDLELGLGWYYTAPTYLYLYRGSTDSDWNYVRVRIWKT